MLPEPLFPLLLEAGLVSITSSREMRRKFLGFDRAHRYGPSPNGPAFVGHCALSAYLSGSNIVSNGSVLIFPHLSEKFCDGNSHTV